MDFDTLLDDWSTKYRIIHQYLKKQIDIYKKNQNLKGRMKKLVRIFNFKKKVNEYKSKSTNGKYNKWTTEFNNVFSPGPDIDDNDFDNIVKPVLDMQGWLSNAIGSAKAIGKGIISSIPLRL